MRRTRLKICWTGAETAAKGGQNYAKVSTDIEAAIAQTKTALEMAEQHKQYKELRAKPEVEPRLAVLEKHEHRYAIKPSIDTMRKKLGDAAAAVAGKKPGEGVKLLEEARAIGTSAFVMAEMRANTPPKEEDIKEILSRPNGTDELDAMIDNLEPEAQRAVVKVAFKARFGCDIKNFSNENLAPASQIADANLKGPNIVAFYKAMQDLPLDHTLNNDSLQKLRYQRGRQGRLDVPGQRKADRDARRRCRGLPELCLRQRRRGRQPRRCRHPGRARRAGEMQTRQRGAGHLLQLEHPA